MALFWLVHEIDGTRVVRIQESHAMIFAALDAKIDGFTGTFVEAHALDAKTAKKIPTAMIGRILTARESTALLDRLLGQA